MKSASEVVESAAQRFVNFTPTPEVRSTELESEIIEADNRRRIGTETEVLCEGWDRFAEVFYGRSFADSPEVDGKVFFRADRRPEPGDFCTVRIEEILDGDPLGVRID